MQLPIALDAILAFVFAIPVVMNYRILPVEGTPYWLFGILFFVCIIHIVISLYPSLLDNTILFVLKSWLLWVTVIIVIIGTMITAIVDRHRIAPIWGVHDIVLQQEAAIRYIVNGKNPYKETYFGTPVESFRYDEMGKPAVNPALYHFVMPPWYLIFPLPFYGLANKIFGYFDGRMVLVLFVIAIGIILKKSFRNPLLGNLGVIFISLSPATVHYLIEGRSDIFAFFWIILAFTFLEKKKLILASLFLGLGALSKQTVWFALPVYALYLVKGIKISYMQTAKYMTIVFIIIFIISMPFLVWDAKAFVESVIFYLSGNIKTGYPVSGYGLSAVLYEFGLIKDIHDYFPFTILQLSFGAAMLYILQKYIIVKENIFQLWLGYSLFLFSVWYVSRYFNNSHIAYISMLLLMAVLKKWDQSEIIHDK